MRIGAGEGLTDELGLVAEPPQAAATTKTEVATVAAAIARRAVHLLKRVLSTTTEPTHGSAERACLHPEAERKREVARTAGLEPAAFGSVDRRSNPTELRAQRGESIPENQAFVEPGVQAARSHGRETGGEAGIRTREGVLNPLTA